MKNTRYNGSDQHHMIWDLPVRITHWVLVLGMICAYVTHYLGLDYYIYHVASGYMVIVAVVFRLIWGVFGTYHARFVNFFPAPQEIWHYLNDVIRRREKRYIGHNPLGALMAIILLVGLLVQAISGLFTTDDIFNYGPLYFLVDESTSSLWGKIHQQLYYILLFCVLLHVAGVIYHWARKRENLVVPMITGYKKLHEGDAIFSVASSRIIVAVCIASGVCASLLGLLYLIPDVESGY